jgi:hypothetical protein
MLIAIFKESFKNVKSLNVNGSAKAVGPILVPLALEYAPVLDAAPSDAMLLTVFIDLASILRVIFHFVGRVYFEFIFLD